MKPLENEVETQGQINILPMIDVIFSILAFFMISTLFLSRNEGLPVNLPQAASAQTQNQAKIAVTIPNEEQIFLNDDLIELEELQTGVTQLMDGSQTALVVLKADETVSHGQVIQVMDRLRQTQGVKLAIATTKPASDR
ncbi:biopolymer transporter ExbD [Oscillatoriales cyanobacterium LEGE 11467]|uniref:Biopolymer transporter ExbD n=1 Tax=Zarconia navalis LEGE 11467 TaxID=1828826 RepID=A0A928VYU3_9CYAN|nr:biopolymer transporter ExbD [Zarconia navalis]MBE9040663.1 biopolymer transporter ExbD [Zarconia navalis LEGE 11467]